MRKLAISLACCTVAAAQGIITTFAGADWIFSGDKRPALQAPLGNITTIAVDAANRPVFVDYGNCILGRITSDGNIEVLAGNGICGRSGEGGPALNAALADPYGGTIDSRGNFLLSSRVIQRISGGVIATIAGTDFGSGGDGGPATQASFGDSQGIATDPAGNIYIADTYNHRVRKITVDGIITTIAGNGDEAFGGDGGPAVKASLRFPNGVTLDSAGNVYIADTGNGAIRKVTRDGTISTVLPNLANDPYNIIFDSAGAMYIGGEHAIFKVAAGSAKPVTIAGDPDHVGFSGDGGPATRALFRGPLRVALDALGNLYVADKDNYRIRRISPNGMVTTVAGNGNYRSAGEGVRATLAPLNRPGAIVLDAQGSLYISEKDGNRIRKVANGLITTYAGTGAPECLGDGGRAIDAGIPGTSAMTFDRSGNLYVGSCGDIRKITPAGTISTYVAGVAALYLSADSAGNLYAVTEDDVFIEKVDPRGKITIFAGTGQRGFSGDGGLATEAKLNDARAVLADDQGNVYIADAGNHRVRKVTPDGIIRTIAGNGIADDRGGGDGLPATQASLFSPVGLAFDGARNLYISDVGSGRVRKITPAGIISTIAGGGPDDQLGDGKLATEASLKQAFGIAIDGAGNLYICETDIGQTIRRFRIREVLATAPVVQVSSASLAFSASSQGAPVSQSIAVAGTVSGIEFDVTADAGWLTATPFSGATPRLIAVTADPTALDAGVYRATLTIRPRNALPASLNVQVMFTVGAPIPAQLTADPRNLSFTFSNGGTPSSGARSASVKVSNTGSGAVSFSATATANTGGSFLAVTPTNGRVLPGKPVQLSVTANPAGLSPGTYTGAIAIQPDSGSPVSISVTMTVSSLSQALLLTQTGMSFTAVAQGGVVPSQSFGVVNTGTGVMNWTASAQVLDSGHWLSISPQSGSSNAAGVVPQVMVSVDATGLDAGIYYGQVTIAAPAAANTPNVLTVFLEVLAPGSNPGAMVQPSSLTFFTADRDFPPGSQALQVFNIGAKPLTFTSGRPEQQNLQLTVLPRDGQLDPGQPTRLIVQPEDGFPAGVYEGELTLQFSDGRVQSVHVTVISTAPDRGSTNTRGADACAADRLYPSLTTIGSGFQVTPGFPVALSADVHDNCNRPLVSGSVVVTFSNGDPPVPLQSLGDGVWQGTWPSKSAAVDQVKLTVTAADPIQAISGSSQTTGGFRAPKDTPVFSNDSVGSAAQFAQFSALAPGGLITIYGSRLADATFVNAHLPVDTRLGTTRVFMTGRVLPLLYASDGQVNAQVPFDINLNTSHQIYVQRGTTQSAPVYVNVGPAQPAVFAVVTSSGDPAPAKAGDVLVIYCTGLGLLNAKVETGAASPFSPPAETANRVTVKIGGQDASVAFAGLAPGFAGLYQINVTVPAGAASGSAVPLNINVAGQTGPAYLLSLR